MANQPVDGADDLILEEGVNDNATDYKAKKDTKSEIGDDLGVLGNQNEEIQPVAKKDGISEDHIQIVTESWNELLKKGELNIGRVLYKNIFQIKPDVMKLCNPGDLEQKELFKDQAFLEICTKTIKGIGMVVESLHNIEEKIASLIEFGELFYEKGFLLEDYPVVLQGMQLTMKAGLR